MVGSFVLLIAFDFIEQLSVLVFELFIFDCEIIDSFNLLSKVLNFLNDFGVTSLLQVGCLLDNFYEPVPIEV
jgi:hypothetical protein